MDKEKARWPGTMLTFILGVGVGSVAALLLAPQSGEELREDIAEGLSDGVDRIRSTGKDLKERAQKFVGMAAEKVGDAMEVGDKVHSHAKRA